MTFIYCIGSNKVASGSANQISSFLAADDQQQRMFFDDPEQKVMSKFPYNMFLQYKKQVHSVIRAFFEIISDSVLRDNELILYSLAHLDGILEDNRARVKFYVELMNEFKNPLDMIKILDNFISKSQELYHRDIASHILVLLIDAQKYEKCEKDAKQFLIKITSQQEKGFRPKDNSILSLNALSFALVTMVKTNQLAREFSNVLGFQIMNEFLEGPCLDSPQIAYNIITALWILSYHDFSLKYFEDYSIGIVEKVSKILDQFSWEKIVRIMLMLFNNLKEHPVCQEHLTDIDCLNLVIKLQNRHWVDEDINKILETMFTYFDEN